MAINSPNEDRDNVAIFADDYRLAWMAAKQPSSQEMDDIFYQALDKKNPSRIEHHPLWIFMTTEMEKNVPLAWFVTHRPRTEPVVPFSKIFSVLESLRTSVLPSIRKMLATRELNVQESAKPEKEEELSDFLQDYICAFLASGGPNLEIVEDTVLSAISKDTTPPHASATILWKFVRSVQERAPVYWFLSASTLRTLETLHSDKKRRKSWTELYADRIKKFTDSPHE